MYIIMTLGVLTLLAWFIALITFSKNSYYLHWYDSGWSFFTIVFTAILCILVIVIPISRARIRADVQSFKAVCATVEDARRTEANTIESAALQLKVVEYNHWLAYTQYWHRNNWTSWFVPSEIMGLEPVK